MNTTIKSTIKNIEQQKLLSMKGNSDISNIWFSTRQQLVRTLSATDNWEIKPVNIFLDSPLELQQLEVAVTAMWLLNTQSLNTNIILPNQYNQVILWSEKSVLTEKDFEELFLNYSQEPYINYQDAITQLWSEEAYKYIEMYLARKEFMNENFNDEIIVQAGYVKWLNWIFTKWEVSKRVNRNNLFIKADYNKKISEIIV